MTSHILDAYPEIYDSIRYAITDENSNAPVKEIFRHNGEEFNISVSQDYNSEKDCRLRFFLSTVPNFDFENHKQGLEISVSNNKIIPLDKIPESVSGRIKFFEEFTAESLEEAFSSMTEMWTPLRELDHFRVQAMESSLER